MKNQTLKSDKGVAGLTILLSLIVMLFVIGLLVMIFAIMGGKLQDSTRTLGDTTTSVNETLAKANTTGITLLTGYNAKGGVCGALTSIMNGTSGNGMIITLGNVTQTGCSVVNKTDFTPYSANIRYTYSYTYEGENTATKVINDTTSSIASVTDWFDIFVVIAAMVVLILLTVIIITAIRSSGMVGETSAGAGTVGTA